MYGEKQFSPAAAVLGVLGLALISTFGCGSKSPTEEAPPIPPEKQSAIDRVQQTQFLYQGDRCSFINPESGVEITFECNVVGIGLEEGITSAAEVQDLVDAISGIVIRDVRSLDYPSIHVQVPPKTEKSAIITALRDPRTRYADLNIYGPGIP